jgi:hypothetical protein
MISVCLKKALIYGDIRPSMKLLAILISVGHSIKVDVNHISFIVQSIDAPLTPARAKNRKPRGFVRRFLFAAKTLIFSQKIQPRFGESGDPTEPVISNLRFGHNYFERDVFCISS